MADYDEHDPILADLSGLSAREIAVRRQDEDRAEDFLRAMYSAIAPALAEQFRGLVEEAEREYRVLERVARWVEEAETQTAPQSGDDPELEPSEQAEVDRVVWQQVARSSGLALLDTLIAGGKSHARWPWQEWGAATISTLDFEAFAFETSLGPDDARQAINVAARAIVGWERLQHPVWLRYLNRYATLYARAGKGTISCMVSASRPWLLLPTERSAAFREARGRVYVDIPTKKALSLYPLGSEVVVDKSGTKLLMTSEREPGKPSTTDIAIALGTGGKTRVEQTASGVRMKAGASGTISFSVPKDGITVHEDGVLLAYDVADSD